MNEMIEIVELLKSPYPKQTHFHLPLSKLRTFVDVTWKIPAYQTAESKKVMPLYTQELNDFNPDGRFPKNVFPGSNPFFRHVKFLQYLIAKQSGVVVGRIAVYIDSRYKDHHVPGDIGWIGSFECIESKYVAEKLINTAINLLKEQQVTKIIGPARFNANGEVGITISGFDHHPMIMEPYTPPYYQEYFESRGTKENDWYAFHIENREVSTYVERIAQIKRAGMSLEDKMTADKIIIRPVKLKNLKQDAKKIQYVYNTAWNTLEHPQFAPLTDEEFKSLVSALVLLAVEDLILIVEDHSKEGHPVVGMSVLLPDINETIERYDQKHTRFRPSDGISGLITSLLRDARIYFQVKKMIRRHSFHGARMIILGTIIKKTGLDALLYLKSYENSKKFGIEFGSGSQIADTNLEMVNPLLRLGTKSLCWRIYKFL
jgi:hypothetical protein